MANREIGNARFKNRSYTKSLYFDGVDDLATVPIDPSTNGFNIAFWFKGGKNTNPGSTRILYYNSNINTDGFKFPWLAANKVVWIVYNNTTSTVDNTSAISLVPNRWYHVVLSFSPTSSKFYINGSQNGSTDTSCTMSDPNVSLTIGQGSYGGAGSNFNGHIAEFCIQNTATNWTQAQIDDLYYRAIAPTGSTFYSLNDTALDQNGENGLTVTGATYVTDVPHGPRTSVTNRQVVRDFGTCLFFDSNTDKVVLTTPITLSTGTWACWFNSTNLTTAERNIFCANDNYSRITVNTVGGNTSFTMETDTNGQTASKNTPINIGKWYHLVVSRTGDAVTFYVNGVSIGTSTVAGLDNLTVSNIANVAGGRFFVGWLDELAIWNVAFDSTQTANLYWKGIVPSTGLLLYYKCNEGSGTSLTDASGNGNTGTITNATYATNKVMSGRTSV